MDAIDAQDDHEMMEELGDLLLQVVFHCQLALERSAFSFEQVCRHLIDKLIRRHPHVFGNAQARTADAVWVQWEQIKRAEKRGTHRARPSALDGIPRRLPSLLRAEKLLKKARKAGLLEKRHGPPPCLAQGRQKTAAHLFDLARWIQEKGWSAEELLREEIHRRERVLRRTERQLRSAGGTASNRE
jgi:hypothetical protein